ncbi:MAG: hypothetical protein IJT70_05735 [Clostridia bacterium]|nr:hypothetical protein [Clostridia bacterium]
MKDKDRDRKEQAEKKSVSNYDEINDIDNNVSISGASNQIRASETVAGWYVDNYSFTYKANSLKLIGGKRKDIIRDLEESEDDTGLLALLGPSGCGKSRLAFDCCRAFEEKGWNTLWIDRYYFTQERAISSLKELFGNTLVVVDDAQYCTGILSEILSYMSGSIEKERRKIKKMKVIVTAYTEEQLTRASALPEKYEPRVLEPLSEDELKEMIIQYAKEAHKKDPIDQEDIDRILKKLNGLDIDKAQPLYSRFLVDAVCQKEKIDEWATEDVLKYIAGYGDKKIRKGIAEGGIQCKDGTVRLIRTLATLCPGLKLEDLKELYEKVDVLECLGNKDTLRKIKDLLKDLSFYDRNNKTVLGVKPDAVGEFYFVDVLCYSDILTDPEFNDVVRFILRKGKGRTVSILDPFYLPIFGYPFFYYMNKHKRRVALNVEYMFADATLSNTIQDEAVKYIKLTPDLAWLLNPRFSYLNDISQKWYKNACDEVASYYAGSDALGSITEEQEYPYVKEIDCKAVKYYGPTVWNKACGKGTVIFEDGTVYDGGIKRNRFHGFGTFTRPDGKKYECWMFDGFRGTPGDFLHVGEYIYPDGAVYSGGWRYGMRDGFGKMTMPSSKRSYIAYWSFDKILTADELVKLFEKKEFAHIKHYVEFMTRHQKFGVKKTEKGYRYVQWVDGLEQSFLYWPKDDEKYSVPLDRGPHCRNTQHLSPAQFNEEKGSIIDNYAHSEEKTPDQ